MADTTQPQAAEALPAAWQDPVTQDVITADRKADWQTHYGAGGRIKASAYTRPLYAAPVTLQPAGVTDAMVEAAFRAYVRSPATTAMRAAIEAAMRAALER